MRLNFAICIPMILGVLMCATPGCTPDAERGEADPAEREECTHKVSACVNKCYEADRGPVCKECCVRNGRACDVHGNYSFYSCQDLE